jgi:hypothetical protein
MKRCAQCKKVKPVTEFNKNKAKGDGLQTLCRECDKENSKKYYKNNKEKHRKQTAERRRRVRKEISEWLSGIKAFYGCCLCGEHDPVCLDFHHTADKEMDVSFVISMEYKREKIIAEIIKCVVICANCHRKLHANHVELGSVKNCQEADIVNLKV